MLQRRKDVERLVAAGQRRLLSLRDSLRREAGRVATGDGARAIRYAVGLAFISWLVVFAGVAVGHALIPKGDGFPPRGTMVPPLFRFDSWFYLDIAVRGYSYNGDPGSSPNIVFAPLFPWLVRFLWHVTPLGPIRAGLFLNEAELTAGLAFWLLALESVLGFEGAAVLLLATVTSAGAYSLHAFYSESTLFFFMGLAFWAESRGRNWVASIACAALGASRLNALPVVLVFAAYLGRRVLVDVPPSGRITPLLQASTCLVGTGAYLCEVAFRFGNPFTLLPLIQNVSWGAFHPDVSWSSVVTGRYLFEYASDALDRGWRTFQDVRTINLLWIVLAFADCVYLVVKRPRSVLSWVFVGYFALIYWSDAGSAFLISAHRFLSILPPTLIMFGGLFTWLTRRTGRALGYWVIAVLVLVNAAYGVFMAGAFTQGQWYYF